MRLKILAWIEAMRLRTLPVSISGVLVAAGFAFIYNTVNPIPAILCLLFAILAQIVSNFANEYYDYKSGLDKPGRDGPRRGVTEGDITPRAMKLATYLTLTVACAIGLCLTYWGGLWLIFVGIFIAVAAIAYSAGPYPLSHHALGEVAVVFFFGIIPVNFTFYVQSGFFNLYVAIGSLAIGLIGANILIVNNYRDRDDDMLVNKRTIAVKFGRKFASNLYLFNGFIAVALMLFYWFSVKPLWLIVPVAYLILHTFIWYSLTRKRGPELNPLLGKTAMLMLFYSLGFLVSAIKF